eukprot:1145102-Pelagomonas_calceolata.AAC.3
MHSHQQLLRAAQLTATVRSSKVGQGWGGHRQATAEEIQRTRLEQIQCSFREGAVRASSVAVADSIKQQRPFTMQW